MGDSYCSTAGDEHVLPAVIGERLAGKARRGGPRKSLPSSSAVGRQFETGSYKSIQMTMIT